MRKYPEYVTGVLILAFACGILLAEYFGLLSATFLCMVIAVCGIKFRNARLILLLGAAACILGCLRYTTYTQIAPDDISLLSGKTAEFSGWISQEPELKNGMLCFVLRCRNARTGGRTLPVTGSVAVYIHTDALPAVNNCQYGDQLTIREDTYIPSDATNPGQFSYRKYLSRQGIQSACSVWQSRHIKKIGQRVGNPFLAAGIIIRRYMISGIEKVFPQREAGVVAGMVLGTYAYLPDDVYDAFSRTGTLHLLAASGFNCFVLIFFSAPLLKLKKMKPASRNLIMAALVFIYLLVVGMKPSMERAAVMACLGLLALPFRRIPKHSNLLFAAGLLILVLRPTELFDVGFQLSFSAVVALVWLVPEIERFFTFYTKTRESLRETIGWVRKLLLNMAVKSLETVVATLAVTAVTSPIIAYYFNYISTVSILCNLIMAGTVVLIFGAGAVAGLLSFIPFMAVAAGFVGTLFTRFSLLIVAFFGKQEWSAIPIASPEPITVFCYYIMLGLGLCLLRSYSAQK